MATQRQLNGKSMAKQWQTNGKSMAHQWQVRMIDQPTKSMAINLISTFHGHSLYNGQHNKQAQKAHLLIKRVLIKSICVTISLKLSLYSSAYSSSLRQNMKFKRVSIEILLLCFVSIC